MRHDQMTIRDISTDGVGKSILVQDQAFSRFLSIASASIVKIGMLNYISPVASSWIQCAKILGSRRLNLSMYGDLVPRKEVTE
jgi:hypothetical protein